MVAGRYLRVFLLIIFINLISPASAYSSSDAVHYSIELDIDPQMKVVSGLTVVTLEAAGVRKLNFLLDEDLKIESVLLNENAVDYIRDGKAVVLKFGRELYGPKTITFTYSGALDEEVGGHGWAYIDEETAYAVYEASWYPHLEGDRATADVTIAVPPMWTAVSNGFLLFHKRDTNTYVWEVESPEIGFSFAAGRYIGFSENEKHLLITCYLKLPKEDCSKTLKDTFEFLSKTYVPYPYPKLSLVEVKGTLRGGHGDNSLIILSSEILRGPRFEEFLAHEAAHSWFGGMVTAEDSKWLTEGFATYAAVMYLEDNDPKTAERSLKALRQEYLHTREKLDDKAILSMDNEYDALFHATVYSKGAYVLHMLRYVIGDDAFSKSLRIYLNRYKERSASVDDFRKAAEETSEMELGWFFDEWLGSTDIPDFWIGSAKVRRKNGSYNTRVLLRQGPKVMKMPLDISILTPDEALTKRVWIDSKEVELDFLTESKPILLEIDKDSWILEENRQNNRYVIRYPFSFQGIKLFLSNTMQRFKEMLFL